MTGDENWARETLSLPLSLPHSLHLFSSLWTSVVCAQRFRGNGQKGSNHRGILPCGQLGCTGDMVPNCRFFLHLDWAPPPPISYRAHSPTPPSAFEFLPSGKGRIVCRVTLWMCNARPRAVLALLVLIAVSHWGSNQIFSIVYSRQVFLFSFAAVARAALWIKRIVYSVVVFFVCLPSSDSGLWPQATSVSNKISFIFFYCDDKLNLPLEFLEKLSN